MTSASAFRQDDRLQSWGRTQRPRHQAARPAFSDQTPALIGAAGAEDPLLAVGLMRSYGDSNLNAGGRLLLAAGLDRILSFDPASGVVRAEAGASLSDLLRVLAPRGWFLPATPGSRFVTLGGAVANDVHGKNHVSAGTFGCTVRRLGLRRSDGCAHEIAPGDPLFHATVGGLGLTGLIEWVEFQAAPIASAWLDAEDIAFAGLADYYALAKESRLRYEHCMAWFDCSASGRALGRGIFSRANWSAAGDREAHSDRPGPAVPFDAPSWALNRLSVQAFNGLRYAARRLGGGPRRTRYETFLYPLDGIGSWNRLYGRRGFFQYQCVVPPAHAEPALRSMLDLIARSGQGSVLAVLKEFGARPSPGLLSFPREGTTLALDFANRGEATLALLARLDAVVADAGGRLYPAKDGRLPAAMFKSGYPHWETLETLRDPAFMSDFWRRVTQ
jgi:L-gulonolactone oxidase